MDKKTFEKAKFIREAINNLRSDRSFVEKIAERDDFEFTRLRAIAHMALCSLIDRAEAEFESL